MAWRPCRFLEGSAKVDEAAVVAKTEAKDKVADALREARRRRAARVDRGRRRGRGAHEGQGRRGRRRDDDALKNAVVGPAQVEEGETVGEATMAPAESILFRASAASEPTLKSSPFYCYAVVDCASMCRASSGAHSAAALLCSTMGGHRGTPKSGINCRRQARIA